MKLVAASKLRRAQDRVLAARPYANQMLSVLNSMATRLDSGQHPLLDQREGERVMLLVVTADRGLCGSFNTNILRSAMHFIEGEEANRTLSLTLVGRRGVDWFRNRPWNIRHEYLNIMSRVEYRYAEEIGKSIINYFSSSELDAVYLVYNEFKSVVRQNVLIEPLLPIRRLKVQPDTGFDYIYEQAPNQMLNYLLPRHVETQIFRAMLESEAAEHGARMTAMDAATRNASEMIEKLTLTMNRIRQASITTEIIEIVSGADALEG